MSKKFVESFLPAIKFMLQLCQLNELDNQQLHFGVNHTFKRLTLFFSRSIIISPGLLGWDLTVVIHLVARREDRGIS